MASRFTRNIRDTKLDSDKFKTNELEPLNTNEQNDLLSDNDDVYVRNKEKYEPLTKSLINLTSDDEDVLKINKTDKNSATLSPNKNIVTNIVSDNESLLTVKQEKHKITLSPKNDIFKIQNTNYVAIVDKDGKPIDEKTPFDLSTYLNGNFYHIPVIVTYDDKNAYTAKGITPNMNFSVYATSGGNTNNLANIVKYVVTSVSTSDKDTTDYAGIRTFTLVVAIDEDGRKGLPIKNGNLSILNAGFNINTNVLDNFNKNYSFTLE